MSETDAIALLEDATSLLTDPVALRRRAEEDGCLYFRELIPRASVMGVRKVFTDILAELDWLKPGTPRMDAIAGRTALLEGNIEFRPAFERFQSSPVFHMMAHEPATIGALKALFDEDVLVHPRNIGRMMFPDTPATPPHQDYLHIRGTENTWTSWIPLGDVPRELGGLVVWLGSHKSGLLPVVAMKGAGGSGIEGANIRGTRRTADFRAGDVLFVHSLCIHASSPNQTGDRMRLSVDYRYQPMSKPVSKSSLLPHMGWFDWEFVYRDWSTQYEKLKYYWKDMPLNAIEHAAAKAGY